MVKYLAGILLSIHLTGLILPLWEVAEFHLNIEKIIDEYCKNKEEPIPVCKGSCYLKLELAEYFETSGNHDTTPAASHQKVEFKILQYLLPVFLVEFLNTNRHLPNNLGADRYIYTFYFNIFHPPINI